MSSSRFQFNVEEGKSVERFANAIERQRRPARAGDGHTHSIAGITSYRLIDFALSLFDLPMNQGDVGLENFARAKLIGQILVRGFGFRHHHQPRSSFVQPMHDARPSRATGRRQLAKMKCERVRQGAT